MVAAGAEHTAAVTEDGDLYGWGWGRYGNLGLGDRNDRLIPEKVSAVDVCRCFKILSFAYIYLFKILGLNLIICSCQLLVGHNLVTDPIA